MAVGDRSDLTSWQAVMDGMIGYTCKAMVELVFGDVNGAVSVVSYFHG